MVFGTFDVLHPGHLNFFRQARKLVPRPLLVVSVARDRNVRRVKGSRPAFGERTRLARVRACPLVDRAVLGASASPWPHIARENPAVVALGYDQRSSYTRRLKRELRARGLSPNIVRLKAFYPRRYKSSKLRRNLVK